MITVSSGQTLDISAGQMSTGIVVDSGGTLQVLSGGVAVGTAVSGIEVVYGVASGTVVSGGGREAVESGGVVSGTVVSGGGFEFVNSGGVAEGIVVGTDAQEYVSFGGVASGAVLNSDGGEIVESGGTTSGTVISGGYQDVEAGGVASAAVVLSGGTEDVQSGGVASGTVVGSGGTMDVESGGVASGSLISTGGFVDLTLTIANGPWSSTGPNVIDGVTVQSGADVLALDIDHGGSISGFVVSTGSTENVHSGGVASGTVVLGEGFEEVDFGGVASGTVISSGGYEYVGSGGVASGTVVGDGGTEDLEFGGISIGTMVGSGGEEMVESGGATSSTVISSGGAISVESGGIASGSVVDSGGFAYLSLTSAYGGPWSPTGPNVIDGVTAQGGAIVTLDIASGGSISGFVVVSGGEADVASGGVASDTVVSSGGTEDVESGGVASGSVVSGGGFADLTLTSAYGLWSSTGPNTIDGVTLENGATVVVLDIGQGGSISGFVVGSLSIEYVESGGVASGTEVSGNGEVEVYSGGVANGTVIFSDGQLTVDGIASGTIVSSGGYEEVDGVASGTVVSTGGYQEVYFGGAASGTVVSSGGEQDVYFGGVASGTVVESAGSQYVASGAVASGSMVSSGGNVELPLTSAYGPWSPANASVIDGVTVQSGAIVSLDIYQGGSISGFVVVSGAFAEVYSGGVAGGTLVNSGGEEDVYSGGVASGTVVESAGSQYVDPGAVASGSMVSSGGFVELPLTSAYGPWSPANASVIDGVTVQSGAIVSLDIYQGGSISGFVVVSGAFAELYSGGVAGGTVVGSNGDEYVESGGVASGTVVGSGGEEDVHSGGVASGTVVESAGSQYVGSGAVASGSMVSSGGNVELPLTSAYGPWSPAGANVIDGVTVQSGAVVSLDIYQGGSISGFVVVSGAFAELYSGGVASGTAVSSSGDEYVESGGVASGTVVSSGGTMDVESGGIVSGSAVGSGGFVDLTLASAYGAWSSANANVIDGVTAQSGAIVSLDVNQGGSISGFVALSGGFEDVASGGTTGDTVISGGTLDVASGAVVSGGISFAGSGGQLRIEGTPPTNAIAGFTAGGDVIDLTGLAFAGNTSVGFNPMTDMLTVIEGGASATIQLDSENYSGIVWVARDDGGSGTDIVACFCRGTYILTEAGEVRVEELAIGDKVVTLSGEAKAVKWIGQRSYDGRFIGGNRDVLPIRIAAGAVADGLPASDLWVSPEHALYIDGTLVPARQLVNGLNVTQAEAAEQVHYFHIELDEHDIIFAEGMPAESFVDCDNRFMFHNAGEFAALYPDDRRPAWQFCAPRLDRDSKELTAIRAALLQRAEAFGRVTSDPDLHLIADGAIGREIVRAQSVAGRVWRFALPEGARVLGIASRSAVPAQVEVASADERALGVAIERIVVSGTGLRIEIGHDCPALCDGFHADEGTHRWTDGRGSLSAALPGCCSGKFSIEVHLADTDLRYRLGSPAGATEIIARTGPVRAAKPRRRQRTTAAST